MFFKLGLFGFFKLGLIGFMGFKVFLLGCHTILGEEKGPSNVNYPCSRGVCAKRPLQDYTALAGLGRGFGFSKEPIFCGGELCIGSYSLGVQRVQKSR